MKKRITAVLLMLFCMLSLILPLAAEETAAEEETGILPPPELQNVGAAVVYNIENDRYIFEQDADKVIYPASTVKLMTAIVAIEYFDGRLNHEVTVPGGALIGVKGNAIGLRRNEVLTVEQLLWALITGCARCSRRRVTCASCTLKSCIRKSLNRSAAPAAPARPVSICPKIGRMLPAVSSHCVPKSATPSALRS